MASLPPSRRWQVVSCRDLTLEIIEQFTFRCEPLEFGFAGLAAALAE
jgi:hypothetical protein